MPLKHKVIVMLGVHPRSKQKGGIHSVVEVYRAAGLFERWPIHYIGTAASGSALLKLRIFCAALAEFVGIVLAGRLALLHAQTSSRGSFWRKSVFMLIAKAARRPVILHLHGSEFERFYNNECGRLRKWVVRWIFGRVDRVIVLSSQWREAVEQMSPAAHVVRIFNPIPYEAENAAAATVRSSNVVLFLGRFGARKGIFDLLEALVLVRRRHPQVVLRCAGDGDIEGVRARAAELGIADCVHVLGWVSGAAKQREIAQAAVYVLPSYAEGLPMGVLEAMAGGAPVVATSVGGIPDAIQHGASGFLVRAGDKQALADHISRLLANADLREQFAQSARQAVIERFAPEKILSQVEALYAQLGALPEEPRVGGATGQSPTHDRVPA